MRKMRVISQFVLITKISYRSLIILPLSRSNVQFFMTFCSISTLLLYNSHASAAASSLSSTPRKVFNVLHMKEWDIEN